AELPDCVGAQSAFIGRRNHAIPRDLERTHRRMKKILLTLFQIAVTVGMLIWVFHDPNQRAKMAEALRTADYRWVGAGILSYGLVALVAITVTLVSLRFDILSQSPETRRLLWILLFLLGSSITALLTSFIISGFNLFHWLPHRFPGREKLIEVSAAYHLYARHWIATFLAFGASLGAHLATFTTFLCVAYAFNVPSAFPEGVKVIDFFAV